MPVALSFTEEAVCEHIEGFSMDDIIGQYLRGWCMND